MAKCVIRVVKLKTMGNIAASLDHTHRLRDTPNADRDLRDKNWNSHTKAETLAALQDSLPEKRRKDAVLCLEYLITAHQDWWKSPEGRQNGTKYLKEAMKWLAERHGSQNIMGLTVHEDEAARHLVAYVVPMDKDGKLNAKQFTGGRQLLSQMQTDFAEKVGRQVGLERGQEKSKARHQTIKEFYGQVNSDLAPIKNVKMPERGWFQGAKNYGEAVCDSLLEQVNPIIRQARAKSRDRDAQKAARETAEQKVRVMEAEVKKSILRASEAVREAGLMKDKIRYLLQYPKAYEVERQAWLDAQKAPKRSAPERTRERDDDGLSL